MQEESNKAAARFDKASSQHAASKEMIRVTEQQQLLNCASDGEERAGADVNHALLEVLNHATKKVWLLYNSFLMCVCVAGS